MSGRSAPSTERAVVREIERALLDEVDDREGGERPSPARDGELRVDGVRDPERLVGEAVSPAPNSVSPARSTRTTPEKSVSRASASTAPVQLMSSTGSS